jgi:hypothetical protein
MLKFLFHRQTRAFETQWGYDAAYMHELLDTAGTWDFLKFSLVSSLAHAKGAPAEAAAAVGLVATLAEDCGPCTQIGVDIAAAKGVSPTVLRAILAGDLPAMGETAALGYLFAQAVLERRMQEMDDLREEIAQRWGKKAVTALGLILASTRIFPALKYATGHGHTCRRVTVAGEPAALKLAA